MEYLILWFSRQIPKLLDNTKWQIRHLKTKQHDLALSLFDNMFFLLEQDYCYFFLLEQDYCNICPANKPRTGGQGGTSHTHCGKS